VFAFSYVEKQFIKYFNFFPYLTAIYSVNICLIQYVQMSAFLLTICTVISFTHNTAVQKLIKRDFVLFKFYFLIHIQALYDFMCF